MHLSQKKQTSSQFFCALNFVHFFKNMALIPDVIPKLGTSKDLVR